MLTLDVNSKQGFFNLNLPTSINDIPVEYIKEVTSHIKVDANYSLIGIIFKEKLSTLVLASRKNKKTSDIAIVPIFVKAGKTDSELINSLNTKDKLIIAPSDIMLGHHVSTPRNPLTIDNILNIIDGDLNVYNKLITIKEDCYFIEFKLVPNCNIHGAYIDQHDAKDVNNFVIKLDKPKVSNIITNDSTIVTSTNTPSDIIVNL